MTFEEWLDDYNKNATHDHDGFYDPNILLRKAWDAARLDTLYEVLRGLQSENDSHQLRAIISEIKFLINMESKK